MNKKLLLIVVMSILTFAACKKQEQQTTDVKGIDLNNFDTTVSPKTDFYQYANGGWIKNNPLPPDRAAFGTFEQLYEHNQLQLKEIVDETVNSTPESGSISEKIKFFYQTGMDTVKINQLASKPLKSLLARVDEINNLSDLQKYIEEQTLEGNQFFFDLYVSPDKKNSALNIAQLAQGSQGLPDKSYYFDKGEKAEKIRKDYIVHIQKMLELAGIDKQTAQKVSQDIFNLESQLANICLDRVQLRNEELTYNKMNLDELSKLNQNIDWKQYFKAIGYENPGEINVESPDFFKSLDVILAKVDIETLKWMLKWDIINHNSSYLSDDFVNEDFEFYGKELSGRKQLRPRWKRVLSMTDYALSEAMGQIYVEKYFPASSKERMVKLVQNLKLAFADRINDLDWMSDSTKQKAIEKLKAIIVKVGYPDKWRDYSGLVINDTSYFQNVLKSRKFEFHYMLNKLNKPVDRTEWEMPPQMVNAYYEPYNNEIVFPAGILQPPFFFANADDAVNYGAIGVVIGHEMTHGFDDVGSLFDKEGNMNSWWTEKDRSNFEARTKKLVEMFNNVIVIDTIKANGQLTLGENIADLGGLNISLTAFKKTDEYKTEKSVDGFTPVQRFYLAYAHVWAENISDEQIVQQTKTDEHSLGKNRVDVPIRNMPEFIEAFGIKKGDKMYLAPDERIKIW